MYKVSYFTETEQEEVIRFVHAHPFATITGCANGRPVATQVPLLIREENGRLFLKGHVMRKTDHCLAFEQQPQVLVLFNGAHCYVSASWYSERGTAGTWNYITVQAEGNLRFLDDNATIEILRQLTHKYEHSRPMPELLESMPTEYIRANVKAIAGFEIEVAQLYPIFKLSQNRDDESYLTIVKELRATGAYEEICIAEEMEKRRPHLFK